MDQHADSSCVDMLLEAFHVHTGGLLAFDDVPVETPQWQAFFDAAERAQAIRLTRSQRDIGLVDILDWQRYQDSWSSKYRSSVKRSIRKLEKAHKIRVERFQHLDGEELEQKIRLAFEIEDRSWKGDEGSSVLKTEGMLNHFQREALEAERCGFLDLWFLWADNHPIAFDYCHIANAVSYSNKIGFDQDFAAFGPGRILRYYQLEGLHADRNCRLFDWRGLLDASKARWSTRAYSVENILLALKPSAKLMLKGIAAIIKLRSAYRPAEKTKFVPGAKLNLDSISSQNTIPLVTVDSTAPSFLGTLADNSDCV